jgi:hypothetical protein
MNKQETLEEAAYRLSAEKFEPKHIGFMLGVIEGVKLQKERSYTLEQIDELFFNEKGGYFDDFLDYRLGLTGNQGKNKITFKKWFEQFKKK